MNTKIKLLIFTAFILSVFSSCFDGVIIEGNNEIAEETRPLPNFSEVTSSGSFNIIYTYSDEPGVVIECESNLLPYIETAVFNDRLDIRTALHVSINHHKEVNVYVSSPSISKIDLSGSGSIVADSISEDSFELSLSGSGDIQSNFYGTSLKSSISGSGSMDIRADCDIVETEISGSGRIYLDAENCKTTDVIISGSGKAELTGFSDKATFDIIGSGKILAYEFPVNEADVEISGSGNVYINVSELLDARLSGSGDLHYMGTPRIEFSALGSGKLIHED